MANSNAGEGRQTAQKAYVDYDLDSPRYIPVGHVGWYVTRARFSVSLRGHLRALVTLVDGRQDWAPIDSMPDLRERAARSPELRHLVGIRRV